MAISVENHPQQCDSVHKFISLPSIVAEQSSLNVQMKLFSISVY